MKKILTQDDFITLWAERAAFRKSDVKILLDTLIEIFEEAVETGIPIKIRGFGRLYQSDIPARKGKGGIDLPPTTKSIFKLSENIRNASKIKPEEGSND